VPAEELRRESFARACSLSPYWREHAAEPPSFTDADTIIREGNRMLCVGAGDVARIRTVPTSGTSGAGKRISFTEGDMERTVEFFAKGMRPLVRDGETCAILMGNEAPGGVAKLLQSGLEKIGVTGNIIGNVSGPETAERCRGAACLVGVPAEVFWLCRSFPALRPRTVLLSADYVPESVVRAIEAEWGAAVYTHYGLTETCYGLAVQCCCREGMHIRDDFIVEIIDPDTGEPLPDGVDGEIVLTSLRLEAMPLVRYRTGDVGSLITKPCKCGSRRPRLGRVKGRLANLRQPLNIHCLDELVYGLPGVYAYEAAKTDKAIQLTIATDASLPPSPGKRSLR
jgi:phenylacetate-coenzyme A ligase PaaK-like adenylate-forming protein